MKIIVDKDIPYIREAIEQLADEVVYAAGAAFTPELVRDADALIIRTRTRCDRRLLAGSRVTFIATATIGFDHIDTTYCQEAGISWSNAPGCNSASVAQYLQAVLLLPAVTRGRCPGEITVGIVGVGHVGTRVAAVARELGMSVLLNDLPRAASEGGSSFTSLADLARRCDVITFHVPLYKEGIYKTFHLADAPFFHSLQRQPILINTSRGEVVDTAALLEALRTGCVSGAVIDVWENEPAINRSLLDEALIGTPHIAGYSADGKANATRQSLDALCQHFNLQPHYTIIPPPPAERIIHAASRAEALLRIYDPRRDSDALKAAPEKFELLRNNYPLRREPEAYLIDTPSQ